MESSGRLGMKLHQAVSFSRALMRVSRAEAVFFPGCALLTYDSALLEQTLEILQRAEPGIGLACGCCGQPAKYLEPALFERRTGRLRRLLERNGVKRIYTACPNCARLLTALNAAEVIPVWETLERIVDKDDLADHGSTVYALHDPCPVRSDRAQQEAVRSLLKKANVAVAEFPDNRENTRCCGNIAMLRARNPAQSGALRNSRLSSIPPELPVVSYCAGCVDAFSSEGRSTAHLLELLFGKSKSRGWGNRLINTLKPRKD
ncbi:MAG: (Fe-S)-binding protein [Clostridiaceae bacterium]